MNPKIATVAGNVHVTAASLQVCSGGGECQAVATDDGVASEVGALRSHLLQTAADQSSHVAALQSALTLANSANAALNGSLQSTIQHLARLDAFTAAHVARLTCEQPNYVDGARACVTCIDTPGSHFYVEALHQCVPCARDPAMYLRSGICTALAVCDASQYTRSAPTPTSDRVCANLTTCASSQYTSVSTSASARPERVGITAVCCGGQAHYVQRCGMGQIDCSLGQHGIRRRRVPVSDFHLWWPCYRP